VPAGNETAGSGRAKEARARREKHRRSPWDAAPITAGRPPVATGRISRSRRETPPVTGEGHRSRRETPPITVGTGHRGRQRRATTGRETREPPPRPVEALCDVGRDTQAGVKITGSPGRPSAQDPSSAVMLRVTLGSIGMPGPMVAATVTFLM